MGDCRAEGFYLAVVDITLTGVTRRRQRYPIARQVPTQAKELSTYQRLLQQLSGAVVACAYNRVHEAQQPS